MSSASTNPYKSRLFNFINRQSLRWGGRWDISVRHLKVAAEWGVQILLYPLYLLLQTGRITVHQLRHKFEQLQLSSSTSQSESQQNSIVADEAIRKVLEAVEGSREKAEGIEKAEGNCLLHENSTAKQEIVGTSSSSKLVIQGIASLVETRSLVIVTLENQILNILSLQQQQTLQQRIISEIANYRYERRLTQTQKFPRLVPNFKKNNPNVLTPVRLFWQVIDWVQCSPVAIAVNLFEESKLNHPATSFPRLIPSQIHSQINPKEILFKLDYQLADLEAQPLVPFVTVVNTLSARLQGVGRQIQSRLNQSQSLEQPESNSFQIQGLIQAAFDYFFSKDRKQLDSTIEEGKKSNLSLNKASSLPQLKLPESSRLSYLINRLEQFLLKQPSHLSNSSTALDPDPFRIQVLIQAAIDYFFGQRQPQLGFQSGNASVVIPATQSKVNAYLPSLESPRQKMLMDSDDDPWLSWDDLFTETESTDNYRETRENRLKDIPNSISLPRAEQTPVKPGNTTSERLHRDLRRHSSDKSLRVTQAVSQKLTKTKKSTSKLPRSSHTSASVNYQQSEQINIDSSADWVETQATPVGYVKHPLETILEWLDCIMLWLEDLIVAIWQLMTRKRKK